ncbi:MAG TPA: aminotransferase class V-fold PLP-dependent enzyme [Longimicrobiaceae bacterium]|nr:aminotransferase class V-fold PLP-dependent enzyme [Longimicrobiaceae bacterium]
MDDVFTRLRAEDFSRLDAGGHVYLDYTGSGLPPESLVRGHAELLCGTVLGNPHSNNPTSAAASELVEQARRRVYEFFDADPAEYEVVFTPNATGALRLVGEAFPFTAASRYVLTADNHNSCNGIRDYARAHGAAVDYVPLDADLRIADLHPHLAGADPAAANLFVFPAQSNFSGIKHPLEWIGQAQALGYRVFVDAAAYLPHNRISLRQVKPDYLCLSFYKMFGYPTGVGVLLARTEALRELHRPWFCGGTVRFVSATSEVCKPYVTARGFEEGTLNFLDIAAVPAGLDWLERVGVDRIREHALGLTGLLLREGLALTHSNGRPLMRVYGPAGTDRRGASVAMNVLDADGDVVFFKEVENRARRDRISIRTGYFCNPGAAEYAFDHPAREVSACAEEDEFDIHRYSACLQGKPVGAIRVSLGVASNERDVHAFLAHLASYRDQRFGAVARPVLAAAG